MKGNWRVAAWPRANSPSPPVTPAAPPHAGMGRDAVLRAGLRATTAIAATPAATRATATWCIGAGRPGGVRRARPGRAALVARTLFAGCGIGTDRGLANGLQRVGALLEIGRQRQHG